MIDGTTAVALRCASVESDWTHLRAQAERYERLARRLDACGNGEFAREMAEGYLTLAARCLPIVDACAAFPLRAVLHHYTPAICETFESLSNNNAIRA